MAGILTKSSEPKAILAKVNADLLNTVCSAARDMTLSQHAVIAMITDDRSAFQRVVTIGIDEVTLSRMEVPAIDGPLLNRVIGERRSVRLKDLDGRPETIGLPASHPPTHSCLLVPIASPSRVYGYLWLRNKVGRRRLQRSR